MCFRGNITKPSVVGDYYTSLPSPGKKKSLGPLSEPRDKIIRVEERLAWEFTIMCGIKNANIKNNRAI
jgi:hypothetical protein